MKLPRVILADDHILVAEALRQLLAPHFDVVATVADGHALVNATLSFKPDAVVVDVAMPVLNGLEACRQLKEKTRSLRIIFLTMNEDPELAAEAMRVGAAGYVLKKSAGSELLQAIRDALRGKSYVTSQIAWELEKFLTRCPGGRSHSKTLTQRQREVIQLLAEGRSMKEAASVLNITTRTIGFHKYKVMELLGLRTNADLFRFAVENRIRVGRPSVVTMRLRKASIRAATMKTN
jgi:DNA-binding NarL/FixJ family response regulator